jgi:hypothetical protein
MTMSARADHLGESGRALADAGRLIERAAHAAGPESPTLGRVVAAITAVRLGARVIPAAGRLLRRYPRGSLLFGAALAGALYLWRSPLARSRGRPG